MPLCGFNQEMLQGLEAFHKGLVETIISKTDNNNITREEYQRGNSEREVLE